MQVSKIKSKGLVDPCDKKLRENLLEILSKIVHGLVVVPFLTIFIIQIEFQIYCHSVTFHQLQIAYKQLRVIINTLSFHFKLYITT